MVRNRLALRREFEASEIEEFKNLVLPEITLRKPRSPSEKKVKQPQQLPQMKMAWGVFASNNTLFETFPYSEKQSAEQKIEDLNETARNPYFLQPIKVAV